MLFVLEKFRTFFMLNNNGKIVKDQTVILSNNRGYEYGDALFETIKVLDGKILFWEDHYFRLMASMRILRMEIPMNFTMEYLEAEIFRLLDASKSFDSSDAVRVKVMINRVEGGLYTPNDHSINYLISVKPLSSSAYTNNFDKYEVDLFKDFYLSPSLLSTLKTNNKIINVVGSIFASENDLENCFLLNTNKNVVEALNGNLFLVKGNTIKTPSLNEGCLKGVMRKQIIELIEKSPDYDFEEASISPFELQKADELFVTNVIKGIQSVTKYRKKTYVNTIATALVNQLNVKIKQS